MIKRQIAVAVVIIVFLVSIALAASAGPLRAQSQDPITTEHHLIGTVDSIDSSQSQLTITLKSGHQRNVRLTATTPLITFMPAKKSITLSDIKKGDRLTVASSNIAANPITTNLIVLLPPPSSTIRVIKGQVTDLSGKSFTLVQSGNKVTKITSTSFTLCSKKDHNEPSLTSCQSVQNGTQVVVIGTTKDDSVLVTLIHLTSYTP